MSVPTRRILEPIFGKPVLRAANNGKAQWTRVNDLSQWQKGTGWQANLYGGVQTNDDWAAMFVPVAELPVLDFKSAMWSYLMTAAQTMGVNTVIWVHDPNDFDNRAEITQLGGHADLPKAAGWNAFSFSPATAGMFFYGEGTTGTGLTAGTQYTWAQFQADVLFKTWTIYRISLEYGWEASGTFDNVWVAELKLNGVQIPIRPGAEEMLEMLRGTGVVYIKADTAGSAAARRFETVTKRLRDAYITVTTQDQLFGTSASQTYPVAVGASINFRHIDISTLYFKNDAGGNGTVTVLGTEE